MTSMNIQERAQHYLSRLLNAKNPKEELDSIFRDLNGLVFKDNQKPIDSYNKRRILEELEALIKRTPGLESIDESTDHFIIKRNTNTNTASDNSDILDVISAMKKRV